MPESGFLDTNVVVRYLMDDPPEMAEQAARIVEGETDLWLTDVVLAETAYVLRDVYHVSREAIVDRLIDFIRRRNVTLCGLDKDMVIQGLLLCRPSGRVSFADALIWAAARSAGPRVVYSFDARFPSAGVEVRRTPTEYRS